MLNAKDGNVIDAASVVQNDMAPSVVQKETVGNMAGAAGAAHDSGAVAAEATAGRRGGVIRSVVFSGTELKIFAVADICVCLGLISSTVVLICLIVALSLNSCFDGAALCGWLWAVFAVSCIFLATFAYYARTGFSWRCPTKKTCCPTLYQPV